MRSGAKKSNEYFICDGQEIVTVTVVRSKRKSLGLHVKSDGTVTARVPLRAPEATVRAFVEKHTGWILEKRRQWKEQRDRADMVLPKTMSQSEKRQIRRLISQRVAYYSEKMGISYGRITMRSQKTRWGSCSDEGNLNFNCRLLFVPRELLDYVVVHELAHRRYMNHSKEFWQEVGKYLPDYKERRERLKQYSIE